MGLRFRVWGSCVSVEGRHKHHHPSSLPNEKNGENSRGMRAGAAWKCRVLSGQMQDADALD